MLRSTHFVKLETDMASFENLFLESKGRPVLFDGHIIQMADCLEVVDAQQLKVIFEEVNADWRQGVCLTTDGGFLVNNQFAKKSIVLWHDTAPQEVLLSIQTNKGECSVKNVWDVGDGVMHSWHNGAAMIVEAIPSGRRYKCNDGRADEDFDDLVFRVEFISKSDNP
jgi:hypothetical protein